MPITTNQTETGEIVIYQGEAADFKGLAVTDIAKAALEQLETLAGRELNLPDMEEAGDQLFAYIDTGVGTKNVNLLDPNLRIAFVTKDVEEG